VIRLSIDVTQTTDGQRRMLNPKMVALIGASEKEGSVGRAILENLMLSKNRKLFPINPNRTTVLGIQCYPDITRVPEQVDLAVIATPARTVPETARRGSS
jgi:acetyltransferase